MRKIINIIVVFFIAVIILPNELFALTEQEARDVLVNNAYFVYNNKRDTIIYKNPDEYSDNFFEGYFNENQKYAFDCNGFVSFVVFNAFHANVPGDVFNGSKNRVAANAQNGWSSHSKYFKGSSYYLKKGETVLEASKRYDISSKLTPGDLIAIVGYKDDHYENQTLSKRFTHIMIYVGDNKYIHNGSSGVAIDNLSNISFSDKVGSEFSAKGDSRTVHGSITIFKLTNTSNLPSKALENIRYPNGLGNYEFYNIDGSKISTNTDIESGNVEIGSGSSTFPIKNIDYNKEFKKVVHLFGIVIYVLRMVVPVTLLIFGIIDLIKVITTGGGSDEMKKHVKRLAEKFVLALVIFILPTIILLFLKITNNTDIWDGNVKCLLKVSECSVKLWEDE